ncbi:MAG: hypothetical protein LUC60_09585, partial [Lachnospiraceae bacterium]|nr:hypothetical protein [Lachnospiraceae bacterium]
MLSYDIRPILCVF